ncbi:MAG TPA: type II toxin-antitoxin system RelE family toxin [Candidatus Hypogeohydataceae bacterium YC41]
MSYVVFLKRSAEKDLNRLPAKIHDRIVEDLISLKESPHPHGAKKLRGREGYRIRVGDYRILYVIHEKEKKVEIFSVAHRKEVY